MNTWRERCQIVVSMDGKVPLSDKFSVGGRDTEVVHFQQGFSVCFWMGISDISIEAS